MRLRDTSSAADRLAALEDHWQRFGVHRARRQARPATLSTGLAELDELLPGRGYPLGAVTEFLVESLGSGELSLLLTALAPALAATTQRRLVFVNPPHCLNAPALDAAGIDRARLPIIHCADRAEGVWSIEQLAEAGGLVAVVLWDTHLDVPALRRLQLAGEKAGCPVFVYRGVAVSAERSPAALRLALRADGGCQQVEVVKCRGPAGARVELFAAGRDVPWSRALLEAAREPAALRRADPQHEIQRAPGSAAGTVVHIG